MNRLQRLRSVLAPLAMLAAGFVAYADPRGGIALAALGCGLACWFGLWPLPAPEPVATPEPTAEPGLAEVAASISEPLLFVERHRVTHANAAATDLLGQHIVGEDVRLAIRHPAAGARLSAVLSDGVAGQPVELAGLGGSERHWEMAIHPLGQGGLLVRLADRTAARAAERMRVDFVANASHELRTPLATLLGFIETLEVANGPQDSATRLRFLKTMMGEARRMQRLIEDLMSLSRIEAERHRAPQAAVSLVDLAAEVSDGIAVAQSIARDRIVVTAGAETPDVAGDRVQLTQLLHNLIGNAIKYGRAGGPVRVGLASEGATVRLTVADEGEGIAREHLPRLTERFYRVDPGRSRAVGGTGLGLAIVKHIVERHRGRLEIDSVVGRGTVVSVRLPVAPEAVSSKCNALVTQDAPNPSIGDIERA
ncbi:ATP-binding protein [Sphingomonas profundi]|uniref:ATP-binding protein n=1 Tax=Alterirhizorhabdus profundi TaxID=2681549 RepID=UPI0012E8014F|nr:ATP-binding protein [Sphingomonas profundi]